MPGHLPWATFVINISGSFLLGIILTILLERMTHTRYLRPFVCVGVLGSWTTMSTFATEVDLLVKDSHWAVAALYAAATIVIGLSAAWAGIFLGRVAWTSR